MATSRNSRGAGRVPPSNVDAEASLIGALLLSRVAVEDCIELVTPGDFYKPAHQHIFDVMRQMKRLDAPIDALTVAEELRQSGLLDEVGGVEYLNELLNATPAISNAKRYAEIVVATSQHRQVIATAATLSTAGYDEAPIADIISDAKAELDALEIRGGVNVDVISGVDFLNAPPDPHDWVMPYVMERDDRMLVTGSEGSMKSLFLLQLAVMTACGEHWWGRVAVPSKRALFLDLEIGVKRTRRRLSIFEKEASHSKAGWEKNLVVRAKSEDIDITTRAGASWLSAIVEAAEPDIIFIGPIYRLTSGLTKPGDIGGEDAAKRAAFALDKIRERYNCALIAETHAAKGDSGRSRDLRPFGSSVWSRWPEFGYGLVRQAADVNGYDPMNREWQHWRGDRDPREWPSYFRWVKPGSGPGWPMSAEFEVTPSWMSRLSRGIFTDGPPPLRVTSVNGTFDLDDMRADQIDRQYIDDPDAF